MNSTPFLRLPLTPAADDQKKFIAFRTEVAGDGDGSSLMIIDAAIKDLDERTSSVENTQFTWGMLKRGFPGVE